MRPRDYEMLSELLALLEELELSIQHELRDFMSRLADEEDEW